jgi:hypothetical protein
MWGSRKSASQGPPRRRHLGLRLFLIVVLVLLALYVLPSPWAFHIGGKFSPFGQWDGYGPIQASNGGHYLLYTHLRGGLLNNHGQGGCNFTGCDTLTGTAQLCARGGQHYTFKLTGAVHSWYSTNGSRTDIDLTGGTPKRLPSGWTVAFHGTWHGAVLPITDAGGSFTRVFTPAGAIRAKVSAGNAGTASGALRSGSAGSFDQACRVLAGQAH